MKNCPVQAIGTVDSEQPSSSPKMGGWFPNRGCSPQKIESNPVHQWEEERRDDLTDIAYDKGYETRQLHASDDNMTLHFTSTWKALADFTQSTQTASTRPEYFQSSVQNLASTADSFGGVISNQLSMLKKMSGLNHRIDTAGGNRPNGHAACHGAEVTGPLSENLNDTIEEHNIGQGQVTQARQSVQEGISMMRAVVSQMQSGLTTARAQSKEPSAGAHPHGGAQLDAEQNAVARLSQQVLDLQQEYDAITNLG